MSGVKNTRIFVDINEFNMYRNAFKNNQAEKKRNQRLKRANERQARVNKELEGDLRNMEYELSRHQQQMDVEIQNLERDFDNRLLQEKHEFVQKMNQQQVKFNQGLQNVHNRVENVDRKIRKDIGQAMQQQETRIDSKIQKSHNKLQNQIHKINDKLEKKLQSEKERAKYWQDLNKKEIKFIKDNYRHQVLAPGKLLELEQQLSLANSNFDTSMYQAALSRLQSNFLETLKLRKELEFKQTRWSYYHALAQEKLGYLEDKLKDYANLSFKYENQNIEANSSYWSKGKFDKLKEKSEKIRKLIDKSEELNSQQLNEIITEIDEIDQETDSITHDVKEAMVASILRADQIMTVNERLHDLGYEVVDETWEKQDQRRGVYAKLRNPQDEEIVVAIKPEEGDSKLNNFEVNFFDKSINNEARMERLEAILASLAGEGIKYGDIKSEKQYEQTNAPEEKRDFSKIK